MAAASAGGQQPSEPELHPAIIPQLAALKGTWEVLRIRARFRPRRGLVMQWADSFDVAPEGMEAADGSGGVYWGPREKATVTVMFQAVNPSIVPDFLWPDTGLPPSEDARNAVRRVMMEWDLNEKDCLLRLLNATRTGLPPPEKKAPPPPPRQRQKKQQQAAAPPTEAAAETAAVSSSSASTARAAALRKTPQENAASGQAANASTAPGRTVVSHAHGAPRGQAAAPATAPLSAGASDEAVAIIESQEEALAAAAATAATAATAKGQEDTPPQPVRRRLRRASEKEEPAAGTDEAAEAKQAKPEASQAEAAAQVASTVQLKQRLEAARKRQEAPVPVSGKQNTSQQRQVLRAGLESQANKAAAAAAAGSSAAEPKRWKEGTVAAAARQAPGTSVPTGEEPLWMPGKKAQQAADAVQAAVEDEAAEASAAAEPNKDKGKAEGPLLKRRRGIDSR
eukprot:TRINITY_DN26464_c0_g1_i14.p1 TRINITY_DN26464_c0_g1~~TRINITY_DN26464_c0_g1_i14.p1  ORF type:complete len:453 (+),score=136.96 TRINITY_DN26464_c0_g1_i14:171-1529(+)